MEFHCVHIIDRETFVLCTLDFQLVLSLDFQQPPVKLPSAERDVHRLLSLSPFSPSPCLPVFSSVSVSLCFCLSLSLCLCVSLSLSLCLSSVCLSVSLSLQTVVSSCFSVSLDLRNSDLKRRKRKHRQINHFPLLMKAPG